jgi:geranylgeranyl diphosphate synthase, type II
MIQFREFLKEARPAIDRRIEEVLTADGSVDPDLFPLLRKGKRMRGGLLLRINAAFAREQELSDQAIDLACAVELAHASSLILDDILDDDTLRRGSPTIHLTRGHKQAMLDTISVLSLPYALIAPYGNEYVTMLSATQRSMARGVVQEMRTGSHLEERTLYESIIAQKTGDLFSLSTAWGAMAAGQEKGIVADIAEYGLFVGMAMQIADDISDLHALISGTRQCSFGSEILLLRSACVETHCTEVMADIARRGLDDTGKTVRWSNEGIELVLFSLLNHQILEATSRISDEIRGRLLPEERGFFEQAAREIVDLMFAEGFPEGEEKLKVDRRISILPKSTL